VSLTLARWNIIGGFLRQIDSSIAPNPEEVCDDHTCGAGCYWSTTFVRAAP
jgi:hypothetical protein